MAIAFHEGDRVIHVNQPQVGTVEAVFYHLARPYYVKWDVDQSYAYYSVSDIRALDDTTVSRVLAQ